MRYSLSRLTPSSVQWLSKKISDPDVRQDFLGKLKSFLSTGSESIADLDLVFSVGAELSAAEIIDELSIVELAALDSELSGKRANAFRKALPKEILEKVASLREVNALLAKTARTNALRELRESYGTIEMVKVTDDEGEIRNSNESSKPLARGRITEYFNEKYAKPQPLPESMEFPVRIKSVKVAVVDKEKWVVNGPKKSGLKKGFARSEEGKHFLSADVVRNVEAAVRSAGIPSKPGRIVKAYPATVDVSDLEANTMVEVFVSNGVVENNSLNVEKYGGFLGQNVGALLHQKDKEANQN